MTGYRFLDRVGFRELLRALLRIELAGAEHVPSSGGVVLAANHESLMDPFVLGVATKRPIHFMAKAELFSHPPLARAMRAFGAFPIERGGGDRLAISEAASLLRAGEIVGIFPQGTSKLDRDRRWHRGAARLVLATGATLVPVRLENTRGILRPGLPKVRIVVAPPIRVEAARPTVAAARALTERLEVAIAA